MNWHLATDTELLTVIFHEPGIPLSWVLEAAEEYRRRHPGQQVLFRLFLPEAQRRTL